MLFYLLIFLIISLVFYVINNKIHFDFGSLFGAGFRKRDDKFGLYTFCGSQGEGKTFSSIRMAIKLKNQYDYTIITNIKSFNCFADTIYEPNILNIIDLVIADTDNNFDNRCKYLIVFDEIFTVLMRNAKNMKYLTPITNFLAQLRKRGVIFITTAQVWNEIPIEFRRLCRFQVNCRMINFIQCFTINEICDGYNCKWDNDAQDFVAPIIQTNIAKALQDIIYCYDTFETIQTAEALKSSPKGISKIAERNADGEKNALLDIVTT